MPTLVRFSKMFSKAPTRTRMFCAKRTVSPVRDAE